MAWEFRALLSGLDHLKPIVDEEEEKKHKQEEDELIKDMQRNSEKAYSDSTLERDENAGDLIHSARPQITVNLLLFQSHTATVPARVR